MPNTYTHNYLHVVIRTHTHIYIYIYIYSHNLKHTYETFSHDDNIIWKVMNSNILLLAMSNYVRTVALMSNW